MKKVIAMTVGLVMLSSAALADSVKLKEGKTYQRWNETSTDLEWTQKEGWQYKQNKTRVYEETGNHKNRENRSERRNK